MIEKGNEKEIILKRFGFCFSSSRKPLKNINIFILEGVEVFIPAFALQRDVKYYENPTKFIPERFLEENSVGKNIVNRPYLPFGEGPR